MLGGGASPLWSLFVSWEEVNQSASPSVVELAAALSLPSYWVQTGHLPHFPKLGSAFVPIWKCGCRGAKTSREAPQDSRQLPSRGQMESEPTLGKVQKNELKQRSSHLLPCSLSPRTLTDLFWKATGGQ